MSHLVSVCLTVSALAVYIITEFGKWQQILWGFFWEWFVCDDDYRVTLNAALRMLLTGCMPVMTAAIFRPALSYAPFAESF